MLDNLKKERSLKSKSGKSHFSNILILLPQQSREKFGKTLANAHLLATQQLPDYLYRFPLFLFLFEKKIRGLV